MTKEIGLVIFLFGSLAALVMGLRNLYHIQKQNAKPRPVKELRQERRKRKREEKYGSKEK